MQATVNNSTKDNSSPPKSLALRLVILAVVMLAVAAAAILVGVLFFKTSAQTALIALLTCLVSALLAHVAGEYPKGDPFIAARMAVQIVVRTALPFLVALWGLNFAEPPLEKSLVLYMILFYLVGLVAEVQLSLNRLNALNTQEQV